MYGADGRVRGNWFPTQGCGEILKFMDVILYEELPWSRGSEQKRGEAARPRKET